MAQRKKEIDKLVRKDKVNRKASEITDQVEIVNRKGSSSSGKSEWRLKPAILVVYKISRYGGMTYQRKDLGKEFDGQKEESEWNTRRILYNVDAYSEGRRLRLQCQQMLQGHIPRELREKMSLPINVRGNVCVSTPFGLVCPLAREGRLDAIIQLIESEIKDFNKRWSGVPNTPYLSSFIMKVDFSGSADEATQAVANQISDLLDRLKEAMKNSEVKTIRDVLKEARGIADILPRDKGEAVEKALKDAKNRAMEIVKIARKNEGNLSKALTKLDTSSVDLARFAFEADFDKEKAPSKKEINSVNNLRFAFLGDEEKKEEDVK